MTTRVTGVLKTAPAAARSGAPTLRSPQPTLPMLLANLVSVGEVALTYQPAIEQLLVLLPQGVADVQGDIVANHNTKQDYKGLYLDFNLNFNLPPPASPASCRAQQQRCASLRGLLPTVPPGDLYCRIPRTRRQRARRTQLSLHDRARASGRPPSRCARATSNTCRSTTATTGKATPTPPCPAKTSRSCRPEHPPADGRIAATAAPPLPPAIAAAEYDPATGTYIGPDGKLYTQANLAQTDAEGADMAVDADSERQVGAPENACRSPTSTGPSPGGGVGDLPAPRVRPNMMPSRQP